MKINYKIIINLIITVICVVGLVISLMIVKEISRHSIWFLHRFYDPPSQHDQSYANLYQYAEDITIDRNNNLRLIVIFFWIISVFFLVSLSKVINQLWPRLIYRKKGIGQG